MALNPPISQSGVPLRVEGEFMILERKKMETEINIQGLGKKKGKGKLFLTTVRMVFVNEDYITNEFKSFDIPLAFLFEEGFEQPIFGANYLKGKVKPLYNLLPGEAQFKLWFMSGGCQTFLNYFLGVLKEIRRSRGRGQHDQNFMNSVQSGRFMQNQAFIDPNDPSVMFVTQPEQTYNNTINQGNQQFYGQNFQQNFQQPQQQQSNVPTNFVDFSQKNVNQNNQQQQFAQNQQFQQPQFQQQQFQQPQFQQNQQQFQQFQGKGVQIGGGDYDNNFQQKQQQVQQDQLKQSEGFDYPQIQQPIQNQYQPMNDVQQQMLQQPQQQQQQMNNQNQFQNQQQMQQQQQQQQQYPGQQNQQYPTYEDYQQQQQRMNQAWYFGIPLGPQLQKNQQQQ